MTRTFVDCFQTILLAALFYWRFEKSKVRHTFFFNFDSPSCDYKLSFTIISVTFFSENSLAYFCPFFGCEHFVGSVFSPHIMVAYLWNVFPYTSLSHIASFLIAHLFRSRSLTQGICFFSWKVRILFTIFSGFILLMCQLNTSLRFLIEVETFSNIWYNSLFDLSWYENSFAVAFLGLRFFFKNFLSLIFCCQK